MSSLIYLFILETVFPCVAIALPALKVLSAYASQVLRLNI